MRKGVLFVCIGNACRSTMAEAFAKYYWDEAIEAFSVGTFPLGHVSPNTLEVLRERGIPTNGLDSKGFDEIPFDKVQVVVTMTRAAFDHLLPPGFSGKIIHWHVQDPFGQDLEAYREVRYSIELMVRRKLPEWLDLETARSSPPDMEDDDEA